jgi:hypothetical protein
MTVNPKITVKYPSLVTPGYIDTVKGKPLTTEATIEYVQMDQGNFHPVMDTWRGFLQKQYSMKVPEDLNILYTLDNSKSWERDPA